MVTTSPVIIDDKGLRRNKTESATSLVSMGLLMTKRGPRISPVFSGSRFYKDDSLVAFCNFMRISISLIFVRYQAVASFFITYS